MLEDQRLHIRKWRAGQASRHRIKGLKSAVNVALASTYPRDRSASIACCAEPDPFFEKLEVTFRLIQRHGLAGSVK
jgi:hypothetical protein